MGVHKKSSLGFTLLELVASNAVAAVLVTLALPSYNDYTSRQDISVAHQALAESLANARSEAIQRGISVAVCASADQIRCSDAGGWSQGWLMFVDDGTGGGTAADGKRNGDELVLRQTAALQGHHVVLFNETLTQRVQQVGFHPSGSSSHASRVYATLCPTVAEHAAYVRGLAIEANGRLVAMRDSNGDGAHDLKTAEGGLTNLRCF